MSYEACLCGALDCPICGPKQGAHICNRYCEKPCYVGLEQGECVYCGSLTESEICVDCEKIIRMIEMEER